MAWPVGSVTDYGLTGTVPAVVLPSSTIPVRQYCTPEYTDTTICTRVSLHLLATVRSLLRPFAPYTPPHSAVRRQLAP